MTSLVYFDDAEEDVLPATLFKMTWKEIKEYFIAEIPLITRKLVDLQ